MEIIWKVYAFGVLPLRITLGGWEELHMLSCKFNNDVLPHQRPIWSAHTHNLIVPSPENEGDTQEIMDSKQKDFDVIDYYEKIAQFF